jgi:hypothetical protein
VRIQLALLLAALPAWPHFVASLYCGCLQFARALWLWPVLLQLMLSIRLSRLLLLALRALLSLLMQLMLLGIDGKLVLMPPRALHALAFALLSPRPLLLDSHHEVNLLMLIRVHCWRGGLHPVKRWCAVSSEAERCRLLRCVFWRRVCRNKLEKMQGTHAGTASR